MIVISMQTLLVWIIGFASNLKKKFVRKMFCICNFIILTFVQGLRCIYVGGVDTSQIYYILFQKIQNMSFGEVVEYFANNEAVFYVLTKFATNLNISFQLYIFILSAVVNASIMHFIYKNSQRCFLSVILYLGLGFYGYGFQLLRHMVALSILLLGYKFLKQDKLVKFIIVVLVASLFHQSAIIFLIIYPLRNIRLSFKMAWLPFVFLLAGMFMPGEILDLVKYVFSQGSRFNIDDYLFTAKLSYVYFFIGELIVIICLFLNKRNKDKEFNLLINLMFIGVCFAGFTNIIGEFYRIASFFQIYGVLLLPMAINNSTRLSIKNKKEMTCLIGLIFTLYFLFFGIENANLTDYHFYWTCRGFY